MQKVHFIAIGSATMHNLAIAISKKDNIKVTGSDIEITEPTLIRLKEFMLLPEKLGWFPDKVEKGLNAVVLGETVSKNNPELIRAKELNLKIYSSPEYMLLQTRSKTRIVVSGSHGKETTAAIILFVLKKNKIDTDYLISSKLKGFENRAKFTYDARIALFEGNEYPTSPVNQTPNFHLFKPHIAIITGIEWESNNIYFGYENYIEQFKKFTDLMEMQGRLIYFEGDENLKLITKKLRRDLVSFPYDIPDYEIINGITYLKTKKGKIKIKIFGENNLKYIEAARLACRQIGIYDDQFYKVVSEFPGIPNNLQKIYETEDAVALIDSAQLPSKIKASIQAVKSQFLKEKTIVCIELQNSGNFTEDFLPHYTDCLTEAGIAFIYFNPENIFPDLNKNLSIEIIRSAFGKRNNIEIFTDINSLQIKLKTINFNESTLLFMSTGNFSGVNLSEFAQDLLKKQGTN